MGSGGEFAETSKYKLIFKLITQTQKQKTNPPFLIHVVISRLNIHNYGKNIKRRVRKSIINKRPF